MAIVMMMGVGIFLWPVDRSFECATKIQIQIQIHIMKYKNTWREEEIFLRSVDGSVKCAAGEQGQTWTTSSAKSISPNHQLIDAS